MITRDLIAGIHHHYGSPNVCLHQVMTNWGDGLGPLWLGVWLGVYL